jgi:hypothetical protein
MGNVTIYTVYVPWNGRPVLANTIAASGPNSYKLTGYETREFGYALQILKCKGTVFESAELCLLDFEGKRTAEKQRLLSLIKKLDKDIEWARKERERLP